MILTGAYIALVAFCSRYSMLKELSDYDHMPELRELYSAGEYEKVIQLGERMKNSNWCSDSEELENYLADARKRNGFAGISCVRFIRGFFTGSDKSTADAAGAIISDLFVYGDVRDLLVQGGLAATGQESDKMLLAVSGTGLLFEILPIANWFPAVLKYLHRSGSLTAEFKSVLWRSLKHLKEYRKLDAAGKRIFADLASLFRRCGLSGSADIMKFVKSPKQLAAAKRLAEKNPDAAVLAVKATKGEVLSSSFKVSDTVLFRYARKGTAGLFALKRSKLMAAVKIISSGRAGAFLREFSRQSKTCRNILFSLSAGLVFAGTALFYLTGSGRKKQENSGENEKIQEKSQEKE